MVILAISFPTLWSTVCEKDTASYPNPFSIRFSFGNISDRTSLPSKIKISLIRIPCTPNHIYRSSTNGKSFTSSKRTKGSQQAKYGIE